MTFGLQYPCEISQKPKIVLDRLSSSMFYLWFPCALADDMILIKVQKIAREIEQQSQQRTKVDLGYIAQGRIVLRVNLAEPDDNGRSLWAAILSLGEVICTTTNARTRSSFLSEMFFSGSER